MELLNLQGLLGQPVRELSLGERMKMELVAALLHSPKVLFLDEPTIGLDVVAQHNVQGFLRHYQQQRNITIMLTSHYMKDVVALCRRVVIITEGRIMYDGSLSGIIDQFGGHKLLTLQFSDQAPVDLKNFGELVEVQSPRAKLRVDRSSVANVLGQILSKYNLVDVSVEEPPLEEVIAEVFASVSITNGRWAQSVHTGGDSYSILDPVFHNRVVTKSSYTITIIAHSEDVYGDIAEIHGETPLEETTVLDQVSTFAYDLYQDIGNYWQAGITRTQGCLEQLTSCLWNMLLAIKEGIIEALEYAYDGTLAMYGTVMTKLGEFKEQIVGFGRIVSEVALSMVGVITTLVTEIGDSLDEIGQALLILITMLIAYGLYYMIVKHGTIIIMALEDV